jgi:hypothetical protein
MRTAIREIVVAIGALAVAVAAIDRQEIAHAQTERVHPIIGSWYNDYSSLSGTTIIKSFEFKINGEVSYNNVFQNVPGMGSGHMFCAGNFSINGNRVAVQYTNMSSWEGRGSCGPEAAFFIRFTPRFDEMELCEVSPGVSNCSPTRYKRTQ